ncbi:MAG TPA: CDP-alcohol phosphatidyltransferase family protein, partial [Opitutaceae bacterium]|nr:CDP-alcohol phosphatidyltransferase family protein [Opitutaceae bacterium]
NLMTTGNLFCGFMAVVNCIHARLAATSESGLYLAATADEHYRYAVYFIFGAALFDMLDGRLARMGGRESLFGAEFDSLADVVSFGLSPALLMFFLILSPSQAFPWFRDIAGFFGVSAEGIAGYVGGGVGFYYLLLAAMRLARFNVITNPLLHKATKDSSKDFVGLPVPAAAMTVASLVLFLLKLSESDKSLNRFAIILPFLMLFIASLMMSPVRYPSGKQVDMQTKTRIRTFVVLMFAIGLIAILKEVAFLGLCLGYILFGLFRHWRRPRPQKITR